MISVAFNTDADVCNKCKNVFTELQNLKVDILEYRNRIDLLKDWIKQEDYPHKENATELEEQLKIAKSKICEQEADIQRM